MLSHAQKKTLKSTTVRRRQRQEAEGPHADWKANPIKREHKGLIRSSLKDMLYNSTELLYAITLICRRVEVEASVGGLLVT